MTTVLLLESERSNGTSYEWALSKHYQVLKAHTGRSAVAVARANTPDICVLDAASLRTSGDRICSALREELVSLPIIHIKAGPPTPDPEERSPATELLYLPFTFRKLHNRIKRYLPASAETILQAGDLQLNLNKGLLMLGSGEQKLTPKVAALLAIFMRHPNELVERQTLMREVWQTDYMGDTRTLDVHIRWIRQAIEENPNKPTRLRTVRGRGYRLELVPPQG
ncbi:MAG: response regulator transcription factor [Anaerolineae bacterium]|nr:response regulator transcription factor [Anaerolineae bacterium]